MAFSTDIYLKKIEKLTYRRNEVLSAMKENRRTINLLLNPDKERKDVTFNLSYVPSEKVNGYTVVTFCKDLNEDECFFNFVDYKFENINVAIRNLKDANRNGSRLINKIDLVINSIGDDATRDFYKIPKDFVKVCESLNFSGRHYTINNKDVSSKLSIIALYNAMKGCLKENLK